MSKKSLTRFFPKTVKGCKMEVPTHYQKEETDIYLLRMTLDMLNTVPKHTQKVLKKYPRYMKTTVHIISIQSKTLPPAKHSGTWASSLNTYQTCHTWISPVKSLNPD
jgi:hypothetical protein